MQTTIYYLTKDHIRIDLGSARYGGNEDMDDVFPKHAETLDPAQVLSLATIQYSGDDIHLDIKTVLLHLVDNGFHLIAEDKETLERMHLLYKIDQSETYYGREATSLFCGIEFLGAS